MSCIFISFKFSMQMIKNSIRANLQVYLIFNSPQCNTDFIIINNEKFKSFKRKENIHKKEVGPCCGFGY